MNNIIEIKATDNFLGDPYLYDTYVIERLRKEYHKYQSLIIAVDFDGTLYDFHGEGFKFPKITELLRLAKKFGCYVYIFTAFPDEDKVRKYCIDNNIPFDAINDSPIKEGMGDKKPYYNILLDDRAGLYSAYRNLLYVLQEIQNKSLCCQDGVCICSTVDNDILS